MIAAIKDGFRKSAPGFQAFIEGERKDVDS